MKKFLALLLAALMVFSLAACQSKPTQPADDKTTKAEEQKTDAPGPVEVKEYEVTIWVADEIKDLTIKQIEDYNANNEDGLKFKATVEAVSEADAGEHDHRRRSRRRSVLLRAGPVRTSRACRCGFPARRQGD